MNWTEFAVVIVAFNAIVVSVLCLIARSRAAKKLAKRAQS
eukprot:SAG11_NODE_671_length_7815_cov_3.408631_6_plen_40_part_00